MKPAPVRDAEMRKLFAAMTAVRRANAEYIEGDIESAARLYYHMRDLEFYAAVIGMDLAARRAA